MTICIDDFIKCMEKVQCEIYNKVDCISSGGCGLFAVELLKRMMNFGVQDAKIRVYNPDPVHDLCELENELRTKGESNKDIYMWNSNDIWFSHIAIEWNGILWDAEDYGPINIRREWEGNDLQPGSISLETMEALASSREGWNCLYNRCQDDVVRMILDDAFKMFDK